MTLMIKGRKSPTCQLAFFCVNLWPETKSQFACLLSLESTPEFTLLWPQLHSVLYALTSNAFTVSPILVLITSYLMLQLQFRV